MTLLLNHTNASSNKVPRIGTDPWAPTYAQMRERALISNESAARRVADNVWLLLLNRLSGPLLCVVLAVGGFVSSGYLRDVDTKFGAMGDRLKTLETAVQTMTVAHSNLTTRIDAGVLQQIEGHERRIGTLETRTDTLRDALAKEREDRLRDDRDRFKK